MTEPTIADLAAKTLSGDIRDWHLGRMRTYRKPWAKMSEREQQNEIEAATSSAEALVRKVVHLVAARGFETIAISCGKLQVKDSIIKAEITAAASDDNILGIAHAGAVVMVLASVEEFFGERAAARAAPDQPDLMDEANRAAQAGAAEADGDTVDPETGEVINVAPEDGQGQGEQRLLTYEGEKVDEGHPVHDDMDDGAGDDLASSPQREALSGAGLTEEELAKLTPEQRQNVERLGGIRALDSGASDPIEDDGAAEDGDFDGQRHAATPSDAPKRRRRRTVDERVADNAAAAEAGRAI